MKRHTYFVMAGFLLFGALIGGAAGAGLRYLFAFIWTDVDGLSSGDIWIAALLGAIPGIVTSLYWGYFYRKKERNETKHLH